MNFKSKILVGKQDKIEETIREICEDILETPKYKLHPDYCEVYENEKMSIGIEQIKTLKEKLFNKPFSAKAKVIYIKSAEKLTHQSQNALLKILEEPPDNTYIILGTLDEKQLLTTILSRCSIEHLEQGIGPIPNKSDDILLAQNFLRMDIIEKFQLTDQILSIKEKKERVEVFSSILMSLYDNINRKLTSDFKIKKNNRELLLNVLKLINISFQKIKFNANFKLTVENFVVQFETISNKLV